MTFRSNNKKLKIAIVGCGRIFLNHYKSLIKLQNKFELMALCEIDKNKTKNLQNYSLPIYSSVKELIKNHQLDYVTLCTPSGLHYSQAKFFLSKKINVITEKPIALKLQHTLNMINLAKKNNCKLYVVKQNRFNPTVTLVKNLIKNKKLGKIYLVNVNLFWNRNQNYFNLAKWRGTKKLDGGIFWNQGSHYFDLLCWLFGRMESIQSFTSKLKVKVETEDVGVVNIKWKSGLLGSMNMTILADKNREGSLTIISEKGMIKIGGKALNKIELFEIKNFNIKLKNKISYNTESVYGKGHFDFYKDVSKNRNKNIPNSIYQEYINTVEFLESSYLSSHKSKIVKLK